MSTASSASNKQPEAEVTSVAHGKRAIHRRRKCDFEQRTRRVELLLPSPRSETMEMKYVAH